MIDGFEIETAPLTTYESGILLPVLVQLLKISIGEENAITSKAIIERMRNRGDKMTGARVRKIINHIRMNGLVHRLCASSKGYWIEKNDERLKRYVDSLRYRSKTINAVADVLNKELSKQHQLDLFSQLK